MRLWCLFRFSFVVVMCYCDDFWACACLISILFVCLFPCLLMLLVCWNCFCVVGPCPDSMSLWRFFLLVGSAQICLILINNFWSGLLLVAFVWEVRRPERGQGFTIIVCVFVFFCIVCWTCLIFGLVFCEYSFIIFSFVFLFVLLALFGTHMICFASVYFFAC